MNDKQRTAKQNRALHLYFTHLADELNSAGLDMRKTLKPGVEIPWDGKSIKEKYMDRLVDEYPEWLL